MTKSKKNKKNKKNFLLAALERDVRRLKVEVYHDKQYVKTHIPTFITAFITLAFFVILFVIFKTKQGEQFAHSAKDMVETVKNENYLVKPSKVFDFQRMNNTEWEIVDVRSPRFYANHHIDGAKNISFASMLKESNTDYWKSTTKKLLYADDEARAVNAWFILSELGYENIYVLEGGYDFWKKNIESKFTKAYSVNDEKAKYDYKKIMSENRGAALQPATTSKLSKAPKPKVKRKKPAGGGGCG